MAVFTFDKKMLLNLDWWLVISLLMIMAIGATNLYSASFANGQAFHIKQIIWYSFGLVSAIILMFFDYRHLVKLRFVILGLIIIALGLVLFIGKTAGGAQRWIPLGPFHLQPSEFAKITFVILIAQHFARKEDTIFGYKGIFQPLLLVALPFLLIFKQPDLGTAGLLLIIVASMIIFAGLKWSVITTFAVGGLALMPVLWKFMKPYQKKRVEIFLDPELDIKGAGYHVTQSKIAVGSGHIWGKGFMKGTQGQLSFLPESHTDFAFSLWSEEWGLVGCMTLIILYLILLSRGLAIAARTKDKLGTFLAFGVTAMIFWQVIINTSMVLGIFPVVGIPFPLISYGGSSVLTTLLGIGLLLSVDARQGIARR